MVFSDRNEAGEMLARALEKYKGKDIIIYALPKGGVVTATQVAKKLHAPLDILIIRKIGHPYNPEYALCAVSLNSQLVCDEEELAQVDKNWFQEELERQKVRAKEQYKLYNKNKKPLPAKGKIAIIVDDGIATGLTIKAAIQEITRENPKKIIIAVPIVPKDVEQELKAVVDELIALEIPEEFIGSVGAYYNYFPQVSDEEVIKLLQKRTS
ncbi:phosphoribosyl transferase [Candidatus Daviesbacteria bacterium RIFCSPLOWO2_01_FULL_43_38]|uniref:Phosphoribosyl transferase n=3 Tax=Candidatus Daviesiibacteriota TaxID=1752718 RepID=A0A1F5K2S0_9BACT|nr:MAG: hypothetical protein UV33_C0025G0005 [Candidatus Daviesbacteria bacterium GW2011_GWA1_42_6]OGE20536.1 MAG: phosphoribosyl transferase [Candidatus Daviesbacteria bacterium RIFCSPHIGHO2_01_FULL_43_17]OGE35090.1 MAG: phosphoribosyl transferase [Candidatus Daviesbacteria bacterium RIFCSPHIGHO2_12_FULL_43_11]OGE63732.1 MAG: phosphoribosyl transferase [Candidatus Daviesbacteria bacterium RIFCSPLOWO2_01_FULL_43_38]OGE70538.1 MAG: phosphoribosyl transferase [Candidatus Daviesbacteria bacterium 